MSNIQDCILYQDSGRYPRTWIAAIKFSYPFTSLQVFCIAEEETEAEELKADVKKFLYDLRMQAEVIVVTMKSWEDQDNNLAGRENAMEAFSNARKRIADEMNKIDVAAVYSNYSEQQVSKDGQDCFAFCSVISTVRLDLSRFFLLSIELSFNSMGLFIRSWSLMIFCLLFCTQYKYNFFPLVVHTSR